jgi:acyl-coenzyme A thioesterase PaaI-like protein
MRIQIDSPVRQVLKGLALNRQPGWNFPGNFLELSFDEVGPDSARLSIDPGPHCVDRDGQMNLGAVSVLADIGMAASMRQEVGLPTRMATVAMSLQFTGAPRTGRLEAAGRFDGFFAGAKGQQGLGRAEIRSGDTLVCTASGSFLALGNRERTAPLPMRKRGVAAEVAPLTLAELNDEERVVFERARKAMEPGANVSFIERFWDLMPQRNGHGATTDFTNGLHVGNRVGHTQGGLTFALAATTAGGALDPEWHLVGISAWYVSPGTGHALRAEASIVHQGGLTAVVRTRVSDPEGRTVLEAVTNHARSTRP